MGIAHFRHFASQFQSSMTRRLRQRHLFESSKDWLLNVLDVAMRFINHNLFAFNAGVWQLRLRECAQPLHFRIGSSDGAVIEEIFIEKVYESVCSGLPNAELVIDAGANAGYSLIFWRQHLPAANIIAIEPDPSNCRMIGLNCGVSLETKKLVVVECCLAAESGWVYLDRSHDECAFRMTREEASVSERVVAKTLPEIVSEFSAGQAIDLFKCDIEGTEREVFGDCAAWINRIKNIVVEIHTPYTIDEFKEDISRNGGHFDVVSIGPAGRSDLFMAQNRLSLPSLSG